jgi:hypothetical protein
MLNRFSKVEEDGTYVKPPVEKLSYGGVSFLLFAPIEKAYVRSPDDIHTIANDIRTGILSL